MFKHCQNTVIDLLLKRAVSQICQISDMTNSPKKCERITGQWKASLLAWAHLAKAQTCPEIPRSHSRDQWLTAIFAQSSNRAIALSQKATTSKRTHLSITNQKAKTRDLTKKVPVQYRQLSGNPKGIAVLNRVTHHYSPSTRPEQWNCQGSSMPKLWRPMSLAGFNCLIWWPPCPSRNCLFSFDH